jgi:predicted short-subunit dehydrogenase-like oxidoreductase (DUF2520 family)
VTPTPPGALALVGPGRAGSAVALALQRAGWSVTAVAGRAPDRPSTVAVATRLGARATTVAGAMAGADLVVLGVPDAAIATAAVDVAESGELASGALVVHLAGSLGVDALAAIAERRPEVRLAALHPLQTLPNADAGADRLAGSWCAVAGDPAVMDLAEQLGLQPFVVDDANRARYHAAACIAGNHVVALLGQVARVARDAGLPLDAFVPLVRAAVDNVARHGAAAALTGPVARGDHATVAAHIAALAPEERPAYRALALAALQLTGRDDPALAGVLDGEVARP